MTTKQTFVPLLVPLMQALAMLGIKSRTLGYELIHSGDLRAVKIGKLTMITMESIRHFAESRPRLGADSGDATVAGGGDAGFSACSNRLETLVFRRRHPPPWNDETAAPPQRRRSRIFVQHRPTRTLKMNRKLPPNKRSMFPPPQPPKPRKRPKRPIPDHKKLPCNPYDPRQTGLFGCWSPAKGASDDQ